MKSMTCRQLGGPCDLEHHGNDANEIIHAQDQHLKDSVAAGNGDHEQALKEMKGRWKRPVSGLKWYRQPESSRKPPVPSESHADIDDWMRRVMPDLHPVVERLDQLIRNALPGLHYAVKWKKAYYGLPEHGWVIEMVAYDVSVNVVFFAGAEFDPPPPLGTTGRTRYVKVRTLDEVEQPELHKWIEQAGRAPGWKATDG